MKVKLDTIAKRLGISKSTVSRALRNHPAISPDTRKMVAEEAGKMGYGPSYSRKGRKSEDGQRFNITALVAADVDKVENAGAVAHRMLKGLADGINAFGGQLSINFIRSEELEGFKKHGTCPESFSRVAEFSGAVLMQHFSEAFVSEISKILPCVSLNYAYNIKSVDNVGPQDISAIPSLLGYLQKNGHSKIGYIDAERPHPRTDIRRMLFLMALGGGDNALDLCISDKDYSGHEAKFTRALKMMKQKKITAWICGTDGTASCFMKFLNEKGIKVPDDVSVTGFGGVEQTDPPLCTYNIPFEEIGISAATHLAERIKFPGRPGRWILVDCEFLKGKTVKKIN